MFFTAASASLFRARAAFDATGEAISIPVIGTGFAFVGRSNILKFSKVTTFAFRLRVDRDDAVGAMVALHRVARAHPVQGTRFALVVRFILELAGVARRAFRLVLG